MQETYTLILIHNAALLITLAYVYSLLSAYEDKHTPITTKLILGGVVSAIALSIMLTSWEMQPGIVFDTRSVLLAGSGLFLGLIPTCLAMLAAGFFSLIIAGDDGIITGIAIIIVSGTIGLVWRHFRQHILVDITWRELYLFGWVVHLVLLPLFFIMPDHAKALTVLQAIWLPYLALYPAASMLLGRMLSHRLQRERDAIILRESEERYRSLFERNRMIMLITNPADGQIVDANTAAAAFYGWSREELRQLNLHDIVARTGESVMPGVDADMDEDHHYELLRHRLADGEFRYVEIHRGPITIDRRALQFHIILDVSEQKRMEEQLAHAQKMEAVGRLAGGVAHDYNNKLQVVLGFVELARSETGHNERLLKYLEEVQTAAERSAQLTLQLMTFARKQPIHPCVLDVNDAISGMLKMLKKLIGEDIELHWEPAPDPWYVKIDPLQIDQMLVNLSLNARDAMPDTGHLTIETQNVVIDESCFGTLPDARPGEYLMIGITDTGVGIPPDSLEHIFEPFFTTKAVGEGTGLGLATVYGIVQQNGGFVHVQSSPEEGTSFKLYLPRTPAQPSLVLPSNDSAKPPCGNGEVILVVEDEKLVLDLVQLTLETNGFRVLSASQPDKALALLEQENPAIDLLLTDVVMPGMNGRVLYEKIAADRPGLKVIYMSGYTANAIMQRGIFEDGITFLQKPFSGTALIHQVLEVLHGSDQDT